LQRWFNVTVHFENASLENKIFSGALLKQQPLQSFLDNLLASDNIHTKIKDGVVYFK
jgi:hypothetical protein